MSWDGLQLPKGKSFENYKKNVFINFSFTNSSEIRFLSSFNPSMKVELNLKIPLHSRGPSKNGCILSSISQSVQFSSVAQSCPTLCNPMDCSTPGLPVPHQLPEFAQTHGHQVSDVTQPSHTLLSPSPPTFNLSPHQGLFKWVSSSRWVAKVLEFQVRHQSFQWIFKTDFL